MSLTRLDCSFFRAAGLTSETAAYVAVNPSLRPGSLVLSGATAVRDSIGSQVACKLALEHFVEGVSSYCRAPEGESSEGAQPKSAASADSEKVLGLLENAFRTANNSVYQFGHQLAAGGRMAASLISLVIDSGFIAAGRVGAGGAYLCRLGELFPFFEASDRPAGPELLDGYIGAHSMVSVELASVPVCERDVVLVFSRALDVYQERELAGLMYEVTFAQEETEPSRARRPYCAPLECEAVVRHLFGAGEEVAFAMMASVGPRVVYLARTLEYGHASA